MTVYVLGAGASAHAGYPLARHLGSALASWVEETTDGHGYRDTIAQLKAYFTLDNFEAVMTDLVTCRPCLPASKLPADVRPTLLAAIQKAIRDYFNTIRQQTASLYDELARKHIRKGDLVITYNYDMAAERSLRSAGLWAITDGYGFRIGDSTESSAVTILKLHGSTNWRGLLFRGSTTGFRKAHDSLGSRPVLYFRSDLDYLGYGEFNDPDCAHLRTAGTISAMVMPALPKRFYHETSSFGREWEPFWDDLWQRAEAALQKADKLVIIGYRLPDADERARELLLRQAAKNINLTICCGDATASIERQFREQGFSRIGHAPDPTFEGWLASNESKLGYEPR